MGLQDLVNVTALRPRASKTTNRASAFVKKIFLIMNDLYWKMRYLGSPARVYEVEWGYTGFTLSIGLSVCRSICGQNGIFYNTCPIHFIFTHLIKQIQKVCRM